MNTILMTKLRIIIVNALLVTFMMFLSVNSYANTEDERIYQVDEKETQLAKKMAERENIEPRIYYRISGGYRQDKLDWSIANQGIDVASEVRWKDLEILQIKFEGKINLAHDWFVAGYYSTGDVISGKATDSDYAGSGRTQLFSRSESNVEGAVNDASISVGKSYDIRIYDIEFEVFPQLSITYHQQRLNMVNGIQTFPFQLSLTQLNNSYNTEWSSLTIGFEAKSQLRSDLDLTYVFQYHYALYGAKANWNLRKDLEHPVSFKHDANGSGLLLAFGAEYYVSRFLSLGLQVEYQNWETDKGKDLTFISTGSVEEFTLNPVKWETINYSITLSYQF